MFTLSLFCLLKGESFGTAFSVTLSGDQPIEALKGLVKERRKPALDNVAASELAIFRVSVPGRDTAALREAIRRIDQQEETGLAPWNIIRDAFPFPAKEHIHVIIKIPGESFDETFPIRLRSNDFIGNLKDQVKELKKPTLDKVAKSDLSVYSVSVPGGDAAALREAIRRIDQQEAASLPMAPWETVGEAFPLPAAKHIHAIIKIPDSRTTNPNAEVQSNPPGNGFDSSSGIVTDAIDMLEKCTRELEGGFADILALDAALRELQDRMKFKVSISKITTATFKKLLADHDLKRCTIEVADLLSESDSVRDIPAVRRSIETGPAHAIGWLNRNNPLPDDVEYYGAPLKSDFLTTTCARTRYTFSWSFDVIVTGKEYVESCNAAYGMRVCIEIKKRVDEACVMQAAAKLLLANEVSKCRVAVLLTDLADHWQFFWLTKGMVVDCVLGSLEAGILLKTFASGTDFAAPVAEEATRGASYRAGCKLSDLYGHRGSGGEADGLEALLRRQKLDLIKTLSREDRGALPCRMCSMQCYRRK